MKRRSTPNAIAQEVDRYLLTGGHDPLFAAWPGASVLDRCRAGSRALEDALVTAVAERSRGREGRTLPCGFERRSFIRTKLEPMVTGLFSAVERPVILDLLADSVVFLKADDIEQVLRQQPWPGANARSVRAVEQERRPT